MSMVIAIGIGDNGTLADVTINGNFDKESYHTHALPPCGVFNALIGVGIVT